MLVYQRVRGFQTWNIMESTLRCTLPGVLMALAAEKRSQRFVGHWEPRVIGQLLQLRKWRAAGTIGWW